MTLMNLAENTLLLIQAVLGKKLCVDKDKLSDVEIQIINYGDTFENAPKQIRDYVLATYYNASHDDWGYVEMVLKGGE